MRNTGTAICSPLPATMTKGVQPATIHSRRARSGSVIWGSTAGAVLDRLATSYPYMRSRLPVNKRH
eukprot:scaffold198039_cov31-Tisochrysis_lutea.AAC.1